MLKIGVRYADVVIGVLAAEMLNGEAVSEVGEHESTNCAEEENVVEVDVLALVVPFIGGPATSDIASIVDSEVEGHVCDATCVA